MAGPPSPLNATLPGPATVEMIPSGVTHAVPSEENSVPSEEGHAGRFHFTPEGSPHSPPKPPPTAYALITPSSTTHMRPSSMKTLPSGQPRHCAEYRCRVHPSPSLGAPLISPGEVDSTVWRYAARGSGVIRDVHAAVRYCDRRRVCELRVVCRAAVAAMRAVPRPS